MKKYTLMACILFSSILSANENFELKKELSEKEVQEIAFKKELESKKQRQEVLKIEIEKLKEALLKEQNKDY